MKIAISFALIICLTAKFSAQHNDFKLSLKDKPTTLSTSADKTFQKPDIKKEKKKKDFTFTINPYFWTMAVGGSFRAPSGNSYYFDLAFIDAVEHLNMAFMLAGRIRYKSVSMLYDVVYENISPEFSLSASSGYTSGKLETKKFVGDFALAYRLPFKLKYVDIDFFGGIRTWSVDNSLDLIDTNGVTATQKNDGSWLDPIVGLFGNFILSKKIYSYLKLDIGGFSAASDWTTTFMWGFGYNFSDNWNASLGWKNLSVNYDKDNFEWNISQYGFLISAGYRF